MASNGVVVLHITRLQHLPDESDRNAGAGPSKRDAMLVTPSDVVGRLDIDERRHPRSEKFHDAGGDGVREGGGDGGGGGGGDGGVDGGGGGGKKHRKRRNRRNRQRQLQTEEDEGAAKVVSHTPPIG